MSRRLIGAKMTMSCLGSRGLVWNSTGSFGDIRISIGTIEKLVCCSCIDVGSTSASCLGLDDPEIKLFCSCRKEVKNKIIQKKSILIVKI